MSFRALAGTVRDFATVLEEIDRRQVKLATLGQALEQRTKELALRCEAADRALEARLTTFESRPFWARLRWLLRGPKRAA